MCCVCACGGGGLLVGGKSGAHIVRGAYKGSQMRKDGLKTREGWDGGPRQEHGALSRSFHCPDMHHSEYQPPPACVLVYRTSTT